MINIGEHVAGLSVAKNEDMAESSPYLEAMSVFRDEFDTLQ